MKRLVKNTRQILGAAHSIIVLGDWQRDAGDVGLLKGVFPEYRARHLTGDRDERRTIHPGVGDRSDEVGRAGSTGRDADTGFSGGARVTFGGVPGTLFVTAEDVTQVIAILPHRVVKRHDRAAGNAEHHFDILAQQGSREAGSGTRGALSVM